MLAKALNVGEACTDKTIVMNRYPRLIAALDEAVRAMPGNEALRMHRDEVLGRGDDASPRLRLLESAGPHPLDVEQAPVQLALV